MRRLRAALVRLAALTRRRRLDQDLDDEIESHFQLHIDDNLRAGMAPDEARRGAILALGGVEGTKERYRERRGLPALEAFAADVHSAARSLRSAPGFTTGVVLMLGAGMAATVAAFSVVNATVFRPTLPGASDPETLVSVGVFKQTADSPYSRIDSTYDDFRALQNGMPALSSLSAYSHIRVAVSIDGVPLALNGALVSDNYFDVLGTAFTTGRGFSEDASSRGRSQVVISDRFWQRHLGGASAVGVEIFVNGASMLVVGVTAAAGRGPDVWIPFDVAHLALRDADGRPISLKAAPARYFTYQGRLASGATIELARAQASSVARAIESINPSAGRVSVGVDPLRTGRSAGGTAMEALSFLSVPLIVLAIACLNAASLLLARSTRRGREWALRLALGSPRHRLVRYVLIESVLLAVGASALALLLSTPILKIVQPYLPSSDLVVLDLRVVLFTAIATLLTALAFGLGPAVRAVSRVSTGGPTPSRLSNPSLSRTRLALVTVQVTMSLALLAVGWQFVNAVRASNAAIDFRDPERVLVASFDLDPLGLPAPAAEDLYRRLLERALLLPAVGAAALTNVPIDGAIPLQALVRVWPQDSSTAGERTILAAHVEGNAADALDLRLEDGRWFQPEDRTGIPRSVVVNRAMADREFGGVALGRTFEMATFDGRTRHPVTVIGVVASLGRTLRSAGPAMLLPSPLSYAPMRTLWLRPRSGRSVDAAALREAVRDIDPRLPIDRVTTAKELLAIYEPDHLGAITAVVTLGIVALLLSAAGLYGLLSYLVSMRTKEIGIRAALGAEPSAVMRLIVRQAATPVGIGLACGAGVAITTGIILRSLIYDTAPIDPVALAGASVVLVLVMGAAAATPARRASRIDPMIVLRED
jgi:predicted permease